MADASGVESFVVQGEPTKDFFISMLVRDIGLIPAIVDLVDNSVDGGRRLRPADALAPALGGGLVGGAFLLRAVPAPQATTVFIMFSTPISGCSSTSVSST